MNADVIIKMAVDKSGIQAGLTSASASFKQFAAEQASALKSAVSVSALVTGVGATIQQMRRLRRESEDLGVSTDFLQTLQAMSVKFGESSEDAGAALQKLNILIGEARQGAGAARDKFTSLGISLTDANGNALTAQEVFNAIANAYKRTGDSADKAAIAMDFFGRKGAAINNILGEGAGGISDYEKQLKSLGLIVSEANTGAIAELGDGFKQLGAILQNVFGYIIRAAGFAFRLLGTHVAAIQQVLTDFFSGRAQNTEGLLAMYAGLFEEENRSATQAAANQASAQKETDERIKLEKELAKVRAEMLTDDEKLIQLRRELKEVTDDLNMTDERSLEYTRKQIEMQRKQNELANLEKRIAKDKNAEQEQGLQRSLDLLGKANRLTGAERNLREAKEDRGKFTLEEMAMGNPRGVRDPKLRAEMIQAQEAWRIEQRATFNRRERGGSLEDFTREMDRAAQIRRGLTNLTQAEQNPFRSMEEGITAAANDLGIIKFNIVNGIVVIPKNAN